MSEFTQAWQVLLRDSGRTGKGRVVRRVGSPNGPGAFLAVDCVTKNRWILLELAASKGEIHGLPDWREMRFAVVGPGSLHRESLGIELISDEFIDVFTSMAQDLVDDLAGVVGDSARLAHLKKRLQTWNRFLKEHGHAGLTEDEVRGLFAELWLLRERVLRALPPAEAIRCWTGPDTEAQDFKHGNNAVEVKSTISSTPDSISISNERQLDSTGLDDLLLSVIHLEESGDGTTLPSLVSDIERKLASSPGALGEFKAKLTHVGFLEEAAQRYTRQFAVSKEEAFRVVEGFPCIVHPPKGVHSLKYRIAIDSMKKFRCPMASVGTVLTLGGENIG